MPAPVNLATLPSGLLCPTCRTPTIVLQTRSTAQGLRRRRECPQCHYRVSTLEMLIGTTTLFEARVTFVPASPTASGPSGTTALFEARMSPDGLVVQPVTRATRPVTPTPLDFTED